MLWGCSAEDAAVDLQLEEEEEEGSCCCSGRVCWLSLPMGLTCALHLSVVVTNPVCGLAVVSVAGCINFVLPCIKTSAVQEQD